MKSLTFPYVLIALVTLFACKTKPASEAQAGNEFQVNKVVYHLSRCNGSCPSIDLEIDSNRNVIVNRGVYKSKSELDSTQSGWFKGTLSAEENTKLIETLKKSNLDSLEFPQVGITDVQETTIIVYYNGKRKYLQSARPPAEAAELTEVLKAIGNSTTLTRTTETKEIE